MIARPHAQTQARIFSESLYRPLVQPMTHNTGRGGYSRICKLTCGALTCLSIGNKSCRAYQASADLLLTQPVRGALVPGHPPTHPGGRSRPPRQTRSPAAPHAQMLISISRVRPTCPDTATGLRIYQCIGWGLGVIRGVLAQAVRASEKRKYRTIRRGEHGAPPGSA